jgi:Asp-tRNA(Asn)/Glu-tRNA(Gln) amidotransferase A subunit family amidase
VAYIQTNRLRYKLVQDMYKLMKEFDVLIAPSLAGDQLLITNLNGNPCVVVPKGFNSTGHPTSISFLGNLYDETSVPGSEKMYQDAREFDEMNPPKFK